MSSRVPQEIISDIFRQLPVKSLTRFKSSSKPVAALIDDPDFISDHLRHSLSTKSHHHLILKDWNLYTVDFDTLHSPTELQHPLKLGGGTEAVGSVNGLVALRNSDRDVAIYNISTRKCKRVPVSDVEVVNNSMRTGYVFYGFGLDQVSEDYKLLRMAHFVRDDESVNGESYYQYGDYEVKLYSLKKNSWKRIVDLPSYLKYLDKPFHHILHRRGHGVLACNALHWATPQWLEIGLRNYIIAFDLGTESFREVVYPYFRVDELNYHIDIGVLEGKLCFTRYHDEFSRVDIWVMNDYGVKESWTKLFTLEKTKTITTFQYVKPLIYSKSRDKVLLEVNNRKLIWYDWVNKSVKTVRMNGGPGSFGCEMYVESLIPLDDSEDIERKKRKDQEDEEEKEKLRDIASGKRRDDFLSVGFKLKL